MKAGDAIIWVRPGKRGKVLEVCATYCGPSENRHKIAVLENWRVKLKYVRAEHIRPAEPMRH